MSGIDNKRLEEASDWFMRLREEPVTAETIAAWSQWCEAGADNIRCYREVQQIWSLAGDAGVEEWPSSQEVTYDAYVGDLSVRQWREQQTSAAPMAGVAQHKNPVTRWIPVLAAAACAILALGWWFVSDIVGDGANKTYVSNRGENLTVPLHDGSQLMLGGASAVRLEYRQDQRVIHLQSGEAFFKVARDPLRPFVVTTSNVRVTAIGTAFTVRADDVSTVVSVTEGAVEVQRLQGGSSVAPPKILQARAGEQVSFETKQAEPVVRSGDIAAAIGWQQGALTYVDEPLSSVIARINRYSATPVELAEPAQGELRFTGTVFEDQVFEWAQGLERIFPLRVQRQADGSLLLAPIRS